MQVLVNLQEKKKNVLTFLVGPRSSFSKRAFRAGKEDLGEDRGDGRRQTTCVFSAAVCWAGKEEDRETIYLTRGFISMAADG